MAGTIGLCSGRSILSADGPSQNYRLERDVEKSRVLADFPSGDADWPTYRANNQRSATTSASVPKAVQKIWEYQADASFEPSAPVIAGGLVFIGGG